MTRFFRWLLGVDASPDWASGGDWHVEFQSLPQGPWAAVAVLALLAAVVGVWYLYRKEGREVRAGVRAALAGLRLLALLIVAAMLLEMVVVLTKKEQVPSRLLVLVDTSESMGLKDPHTDEQAAGRGARQMGLLGDSDKAIAEEIRGRTRLELAQRALGGGLGPLGDGHVLFCYGFAGEVKPLEDAAAVGKLQVSGASTGIGDALSAALAAHRGQPLAGVLLVTDGQSNSGEDPLSVAKAAGKEAVPIHALAVGTAEGPRNVRLADLETSPAVFVRDPAEISVLVESRGLKGTTAVVTLEQRKEDGPWSEVGRAKLVLGEDTVLQRVAFPFTPEATGQLDFRAQVADVGPELTAADNTATASVKVIRQKIRVLVIAGYPHPEVQFLRNALLRDTALEFASWLQSAAEGYEHIGHRPIRRLPANQAELDHYDVLVLFDPDLRKLGPAWPEMITKFVGEAGGGLIFVAGEMYAPQLFDPSSAGAGGDNSWLKVLPVVREAGLYQSTAEVRLSSRESWTLELTPQGYEDSIFRFSADATKNRAVLASLPGMYWHFPVTRAKRGASVLAYHGDPRMRNTFGRHVLMATQLYGPGRTVFLGFDSTYRWRYLDEAYFDGFWARLVDRVGRSKLLGGRHPFTLTVDKSVYRVGDRVSVTARFVSSADGAAMAGGLSGEVEVGGRQAAPLSLEPMPDDIGAFQASFVATEPGAYLVRVLPAGEVEIDSGPRAATLALRVELPQREIDNPTLNRALLEDMARASGGRVFLLEDADEIPAAFNVREVERTLELRDEVWDAPVLFGGLMLLLAAEWLWRKRYRMA